MRDITDSKIKEQKTFFTMKAEAFRILAGGLAHDYNNLLMAIWGNISLLKYEKNEVTQQELIEEAEKACEFARSLTHQFITLSKGAMINKSDCDIKEVLRAALESAVKEKDIGISLDYPPMLPMVELDSEQMQIVFRNIIINAVEAMPEGGKLHIRTEILSTGQDDQKGVPFLEISFEDTGRGIPESDLLKLFDPYFTTKSMGAQKGVGLGLAAAQAIVNRHGGNIHISSAPGNGTTVIVSLPIEQSSSHEKADINIFPTGKTPVVLMMEDEISLRKLCRRMLQKLNCEVITACNGNEMIESYQMAVENNVTIDLVILDQNIKGCAGGFEVLERLKKEGFDNNAILVTGSPHDPPVDNLKKYGFDDLISKPYTKKEFETIIRKYLPV
jgi:CheY-like chemotaxis protein/two-component sensor histidine kinase